MPKNLTLNLEPTLKGWQGWCSHVEAQPSGQVRGREGASSRAEGTVGPEYSEIAERTGAISCLKPLEGES